MQLKRISRLSSAPQGPHDKPEKFSSTEDITVSDTIIEQVIGQEHAVNVIRKAAQQRRHVLLIGEPGVGKSMLGLALAELLPKEKLVDILAYPNQNDENTPIIAQVPKSQGRQIVMKSRQGLAQSPMGNVWLMLLVVVGL